MYIIFFSLLVFNHIIIYLIRFSVLQVISYLKCMIFPELHSFPDGLNYQSLAPNPDPPPPPPSDSSKQSLNIFLFINVIIFINKIMKGIKWFSYKNAIGMTTYINFNYAMHIFRFTWCSFCGENQLSFTQPLQQNTTTKYI